MYFFFRLALVLIDEEEELSENDEGKEDLEDDSGLKNDKVKDDDEEDLIKKNMFPFEFVKIDSTEMLLRIS